MKRFKSIALAMAAVLVVAAYVLPIQPGSAVSSASLSIVPKKSYTIEPGKSIKDTLVIRNLDGGEALELSLRVVDFTYTDDGGTPKLMLDENAPQTTWSLKPFLTVPDTVTIPPKGSKTLDMSVAIPEGHGAGSYYSAIVYSSGSPVDGGNVGLSASGVTLVFTSIPGDVDESLKLEQFGAYTPPKGGQEASYNFIATNEPQVMAYTLKNSGNVTESPVGSITLKDMFGRERIITNVNPNSSLALIGQTRTFTACVELENQDVEFDGTRSQSTACTSPGLWPGLYTASLDLFYGQNGNNTQEIVKTIHFWYLPWWFLIVLVIVIALVAYYIRKAVLAVRGKLNRPQSKKLHRRR